MGFRVVKFVVFLLFLATGVVLSFYSDLQQFRHPQQFIDTITAFGTTAPLVFIGFKALLGVFFLPGTPVNIAAGAVFGPLPATFYVLVGDLLGAVIAFWIARYFAGDFIHQLLKIRFKKLYQYIQQTEQHGFWVTLFLRLAQIFPFNLLNLALGITRVKLRDFALATLIGSAPGIYLYVSLGDALLDQEAETVGILIGFIAVLWLFGLGMREHYRHRQKENKDVSKS